jgi:hypothetical protein
MITIVCGTCNFRPSFQIYAESSYLLDICVECAQVVRTDQYIEVFNLPRRNEFPSNSVVVELRNVRLQSHTSHKDLSCGLVLSDFNLNSQFLRILSPARIYIYFLLQEIMPGRRGDESNGVRGPIRTLRSRGSEVRKPSASTCFPSQVTFISQVC